MMSADDRIRLDVAAVDWADPAVPRAFDQLLAARTEDDAWAAYHAMLDAVGDNHSGQLYEIAGPAAAPLAATACRGDEWTRFAAIEVLIDCLSWADDDDLRYVAGDGSSVPVRVAIVDAVRGIRGELAAMVEGAGQTAQSAGELLDALAEAEADAPDDAHGRPTL